MKDKKINIFKILLYAIYIFSAVFFMFKSEYGKVGLSLLCLVIIFILNKIYSKNLTILDRSLFIAGNLFILFSFLLGSCYNLYDKIKYYDDLLHFASGFISVKIGWNILSSLKNININNNKLLVFVIILFFSMGISSICEISEYALDVLFNMHTQSGGLKDTMHDMIDALAGSCIMLLYYTKIKFQYNTK
jgi:uncharacterized membrane protein YjdF